MIQLDRWDLSTEPLTGADNNSPNLDPEKEPSTDKLPISVMNNYFR